MRKDDWWILAGSALPLLFIFLLPLVGAAGKIFILTLVLFSFIFHILFLTYHPVCSERLEYQLRMLKHAKRERGKTMIGFNIKKFGFACGFTSALLYLGCVLVMALVGKEKAIWFFNSLLHGLDVTTIIRMNMPVSEMAMGIIQIFVLGWLTGATIASIYNFGLKK